VFLTINHLAAFAGWDFPILSEIVNVWIWVYRLQGFIVGGLFGVCLGFLFALVAAVALRKG
jgi:hypothetical protein